MLPTLVLGDRSFTSFVLADVRSLVLVTLFVNGSNDRSKVNNHVYYD